MSFIKLRKIRENDLHKLAEFLSEGFPTRSPELLKHRFSMWWSNNPVFSLSIPLGWILEKDESEIYGFIGNIPVKYLINGSESVAVASSSWYVKPAVRGIYSIKLLLEFIKQKNVGLLLSTTPNNEVKKIFQKFGFLSFNLPLNNTEYWYVLNHKNIFDLFLLRRIKSKPLLSLLKMASFFIKMISPIGGLIQKKLFPHVKNNDFSCSICTYCDDSFTELWNTHKKNNLTTLYRDAETLNWLYFSKVVADKRHVIKCTHKINNKLTGYFVFDLNSTQKEGVKILQLKDGYIPEFNKKIFLSLFSFSIHLAKNYNASALRFWSVNKDMEKLLKKYIKIRKRCIFDYLYKFNVESELSTINYEFIPSSIDPDRGII